MKVAPISIKLMSKIYRWYICFTYKGRAAYLQYDLGLNNFRATPKGGISNAYVLLDDRFVFFFWDDDLDFLKEGATTYPVTPISSSLNLPIIFCLSMVLLVQYWMVKRA